MQNSGIQSGLAWIPLYCLGAREEGTSGLCRTMAVVAAGSDCTREPVDSAPPSLRGLPCDQARLGVLP